MEKKAQIQDLIDGIEELHNLAELAQTEKVRELNDLASKLDIKTAEVNDLTKLLERAHQHIRKIENDVTRGHGENCVCVYCESRRNRKTKTMHIDTNELIRCRAARP